MDVQTTALPASAPLTEPARATGHAAIEEAWRRRAAEAAFGIARAYGIAPAAFMTMGDEHFFATLDCLKVAVAEQRARATSS